MLHERRHQSDKINIRITKDRRIVGYLAMSKKYAMPSRALKRGQTAHLRQREKKEKRERESAERNPNTVCSSIRIDPQIYRRGIRIRIHGFANFNRVIYYTCYVISSNIHRVAFLLVFRADELDYRWVNFAT